MPAHKQHNLARHPGLVRDGDHGDAAKFNQRDEHAENRSHLDGNEYRRRQNKRKKKKCD